MFGSEILDVAIGLVFVFLLTSLICSALREAAEAWFKTRAVFLEDGLRQLLRDEAGDRLVKAVYDHPAVYGLYRGAYDPKKVRARGFLARTNLPAYIPASNFAVALLDLTARGPSTGDEIAASAQSPRLTIENVRASIGTLEVPPVQRALLSALDLAEGDLARAQQNVEAWYNGAMDRVSGWYKRRTQAWLFLLGVMTAAAFNVNPLAIARHLYHDEGARAALVAHAGAVSQDASIMHAPLDTLMRHVDELDLPMGWQHGVVGEASGEQAAPADYLLALVGWLITGLAVSLGAPFWFDLLNKFMVIRSTVKPHEKSPEEASEDRQAPQRRSGRAAGGASPPDGAGGSAVPDLRALARQLPAQPTMAP